MSSHFFWQTYVRTWALYTDGQKKRHIEILQYFKNVLVNIGVLVRSIIITEGYIILNWNFMKTSFLSLNARAAARFARAAIETTSLREI